MNLFIGLLNIAIENYDKYEEFLLKKAKVVFFLTSIILSLLDFFNFNDMYYLTDYFRN